MINFTNLFTGLGRVGFMFNSQNAYAATTIPTNTAAIFSDLSGYIAQLGTLQQDSIALQGFSRSFNSNDIQQITQNVIIQVVNADVPQINTSLFPALVELISQMSGDSQSIPSNTVSASYTANANNIGTGQVVISYKNQLGQVYQMPYDETLTLTCTSDSYTGGQTEGNELFNLSGQYADSFGSLDYGWPLGSGSSVSFNAVDALIDAGTNFLTNSSFESWTSNTPANWTILTGTAGTEVKETTSIVYAGTAAAQFVGTGTDPSIQQVFGDGTTGTSTSLQPLTPYAFACWMKASTSITGSVTFELYDITNSAVMQDYSGNNLSVTVNLNTLTTSYAPINGVFNTPRVLPASYGFRVSFTSITSTDSVYLDQLSFGNMFTPYPGSLLYQVVSGNVPFVIGDQFSIVVDNNYDSLWATYIERTCNLNAQGLILPSSGSATISNSLLS